MTDLDRHLPTEPGPGLPEARPSRRSMLTSPWVALTAAAGAVALASCDLTSAPFDRNVHLLKRLTFGPTPAERDAIGQQGEAAWLAAQLGASGADAPDVAAEIATMAAIAMSPVELEATYKGGPGTVEAAGQFKLAWLIRATHSPNQIHERLVDFWSDHFNVPQGTPNTILLKIVEDREVIRPLALTRFKDLLVGSAQSPAMLYYLDNYTSFAGKINENYARELLELHTVGVDGGYTEEDVVSLARLLTGWTIDQRTFEFRFVPQRHDSAPLTVLGWERPTSGDPLGHGVAFLEWLAVQRATAQFVCTKMARRFVADRPSAALVDAMVQAWMANDSAIPPVIQAMVTHPDFDAAAGEKFRRPLDYLTFALRAAGSTVTASTDRQDLGTLYQLLVGLGQVPFDWAAPNGYPDVEGAWLNGGAMLQRWNAVGDLLANAVPVVSSDTWPIVSPFLGQPKDAIYDGVAQALLAEPTTSAGRVVLDTATGWSGDEPPTGWTFLGGMTPLVVALLTSTDAQYR